MSRRKNQSEQLDKTLRGNINAVLPYLYHYAAPEQTGSGKKAVNTYGTVGECLAEFEATIKNIKDMTPADAFDACVANNSKELAENKFLAENRFVCLFAIQLSRPDGLASYRASLVEETPFEPVARSDALMNLTVDQMLKLSEEHHVNPGVIDNLGDIRLGDAPEHKCSVERDKQISSDIRLRNFRSEKEFAEHCKILRHNKCFEAGTKCPLAANSLPTICPHYAGLGYCKYKQFRCPLGCHGFYFNGVFFVAKRQCAPTVLVEVSDVVEKAESHAHCTMMEHQVRSQTARDAVKAQAEATIARQAEAGKNNAIPLARQYGLLDQQDGLAKKRARK